MRSLRRELVRRWFRIPCSVASVPREWQLLGRFWRTIVRRAFMRKPGMIPPWETAPRGITEEAVSSDPVLTFSTMVVHPGHNVKVQTAPGGDRAILDPPSMTSVRLRASETETSRPKRVSRKVRKKTLSLVHAPVSVPLGRWRRGQYVNNVKNNIKGRPPRHHFATRPLAKKSATSNTAPLRS